MALTAAAKAEIIKAHGQTKNDTGSSAVQIALLTARINGLTEHLKAHNHDFHTRYGLTKLVNRRHKLLRYLKNTDVAGYRKLIKMLEIREVRD